MARLIGATPQPPRQYGIRLSAMPPTHAPRSLSREGATEADALRHLHLRLVNGDDAAADGMFAVLVPRLHRALSARFQRVPWDWRHDAAVDALLDYFRSPGRFDPARGVPLTKWLEYPARRNLLNRLTLEERRSRYETKVPDSELMACAAPAPDPEPDLGNYLRVMFPDWSDVEYSALQLWMCGERRTSVFARVVGAEDFPPREQRTMVKRLKDRLFKRLRRQTVARQRRFLP